MAPPLVTRNTGDIIPASDHNDVKAYIEDATYHVNTQYLQLGGSVTVIDQNVNGSFLGSITASNIISDNWSDVSIIESQISDFGDYIPQGVLPVGSIPDLEATYLTQGILPTGSIPSLTSLYLPQGALPVGSIPTLTAAKVSDFDTEVQNNGSVVANTTHRSSDGTDHTYINQDIRTTASPQFVNGSFTGSVVATSFIGDGSSLTGIPSTGMVYGLDAPDYIITLSAGTATGIDLSDGTTVSSGTTHSTVIQAVIDDAEANGKGWIHIKGGTYNINTTLTLNGNIRLSGDGQEHTELRAVNSLNANMLTINSTNSATQYRVIIEDMKFDGNDANQTSGNCIVGYGIIQSRFHRLHFENFYDYGIYLWDTGGGTGAYGHHNQIFDCLFDQSDIGLGTGVHMRNNDENTISHSQFQYLKLGISDNTGFNQIEMNSFVNQGTGIYILDASRTRIINNVFDLLTERGIHLKGAFNTVIGNTFYENSNNASGTYSDVYIDYYGTNTLSGNTFLVTGSTRSGIREAGNAAEDTYGQNLITGNMFVEMSAATDFGGTGWTQSAIEQTNLNHLYGNIARDSVGSTFIYDTVNTDNGSFTGSVVAGSFIGDGSGLTGISSGGTPGGTNGDIQYNNSSSFGGTSGSLIWNGSSLGVFNSAEYSIGSPTRIWRIGNSASFDNIDFFTPNGATPLQLQNSSGNVNIKNGRVTPSYSGTPAFEVTGASGQSVDIFTINDNSSNKLFSITSTGLGSFTQDVVFDKNIDVTGSAIAGSFVGYIPKAMGVVVDDTGSATRPDFDIVQWIGSLEPSNAANNDLWINTT